MALVLLACSGTAGAARQGDADRKTDAAIRAKIRQMTLQEKVGQMFVPYVYGETADTMNPGDVAANRKIYGVDNAAQLIEKYRPGGIIYFAWSNNLKDPRQISHLSNDIQRAAMEERPEIPLLISTDQEQGVVVRVDEPATQFPGSMALGATRDEQLARTAAAITGQELRAVGINQDFAPVADVNVNAQNPVIGVRSFGSDTGLVSGMVGAQVEGYQGAEGVAATAKHFPGHGDTSVDSHTGLPVINHSREELERIDLPPFKAAIDAGVDAIMTAHIVVPALDNSGRPATLSKPILTGLLREEMGYDGLIVTDALTMEGVRQQFGDDRVPVEAIKAGADMMLMPPDMDLAYNAVLDAVRGGEIPRKRIDRSVYRILEVKHERGLFEDPYADEEAVDATVGTPANLAAANAITEKTITLVKNDAGALPLAADSGKEALVTGWGVTTTGDLAAGMQGRGVPSEAFETGLNPDDEKVSAAVSRAESKDLVVVTTNKAWTYAGQQKLVKALLDTGKLVVVAAVRDPYDIAHFDAADTYLATYSYRPVSTKALVRVLFDEVDPGGRLPVDIPTADDPQKVLYPYGHGLSYGG
jgi:beta-N-acetylhexosaminidase